MWILGEMHIYHTTKEMFAVIALFASGIVRTSAEAHALGLCQQTLMYIGHPLGICWPP